ncbi:MAG: STAS domain-containing protein [Candidatus Eremiobacteraeota bacterium]|nr:STAS domain-containing protein [Candidatus Eremiobacteraeota bacterium]
MAHVVVFAGEYDLACKQQFRDELARLRHHTDVVLDFIDVTYVDSTIVTELLLLARDRVCAGLAPQKIVLSNNSGVRRVFDIVQLGKMIPLVNSFKAASHKRETEPVRYAFSGRLAG